MTEREHLFNMLSCFACVGCSSCFACFRCLVCVVLESIVVGFECGMFGVLSIACEREGELKATIEKGVESH